MKSNDVTIGYVCKYNLLQLSPHEIWFCLPQPNKQQIISYIKQATPYASY
mgnify:CR=1 FL=1